jgi:anti-sigma factor RsiW
LWVSDDLIGADRRRVERHLIVCPECRRHERALAASLRVLRRTSAQSPVSDSAPSLWPSLARQIRESRHTPQTSPVFAALRPLLGPWPLLGLSMGLFVAAALTLGIFHQLAQTRALISTNARPSRPATTTPSEASSSQPFAQNEATADSSSGTRPELDDSRERDAKASY